MFKKIDLAIEKITKFCGIVSGSILFLIVLTIVPDVLGRYLFNSPIAGILELNETLIVFCVFLGLGWTQVQRGHVRMELVLSRLPTAPQTFFNLIVWLIAFAFVSIMTIMTSKQAYISLKISEHTLGMISFPVWPAKIALAIGCLFLSLQLLRDTIKEFHKCIVYSRKRE